MSRSLLHPMRDARFWGYEILPSREWRFWQKVDGGDVTSCWQWMGALLPEGYGSFQWSKGVRRNAHKVAYEWLVGTVPDGLHLDHLCRNRACVNPWHLEPVTPLVNVQRGEGNGSKSHCPSGHPYIDPNVYVNGGRRYCRTCRRARAATSTQQAA